MKLKAQDLSNWIIIRYKEVLNRNDLSHLKLQKLSFYCAGAMMAGDLYDDYLTFEAWKYGPVNREIWDNFKDYGRSAIEGPIAPVSFMKSEAKAVLDDCLKIYGELSANTLVHESHLELPWIKAFHCSSSIDSKFMKEYFKDKFSRGNIFPPNSLIDRGSFELDSIPVARFNSLSELAEFVFNNSQEQKRARTDMWLMS